MRTLFVGDVHACSGELSALLALARAERVVLLGDLFTKGPDPQGVWRVIVEHGCEAILGNHDAYVLDHAGSPKAPVLPDEALAWLAPFRSTCKAPLLMVGPGWPSTLGSTPTGAWPPPPANRP